MMMNLFSIFEPAALMNLNLNWMSLILPGLVFFYKYWIMTSNVMLIIINFFNFILKDLKNNLNKSYLMLMIYIKVMMFVILFWNFLGLFPYIFTPSSHMTISYSLSFFLWMSLMIYGWYKNMDLMFEHMIPVGTPMMLSMFMVLIETTSNLIRPITLSVRLTANMIAGHLLISLLSEICESVKIMYLMVFPVMMILFCLEIAVAMIQSYVFSTLISLYLNEV